MSSKASTAILKVLTTPSKIASTLDWRKVSGSSILTLDIRKNQIKMAIACHPSFGVDDTTVEELPSIPMKKTSQLTEDGLEQLSDIVKDYKVCGVLVSWPVQEQTGRMGAACGRVLHTLENILESKQEGQTTIFSAKSRPICLWDSKHVPLEHADKWGRSVPYSLRTSSPPPPPTTTTTSKDTSSSTIKYKLSEQEPFQTENHVAVNVWNDFCRAHWPQLFEQTEQEQHAQLFEGEGSMTEDTWIVVKDDASEGMQMLM